MTSLAKIGVQIQIVEAIEVCGFPCGKKQKQLVSVFHHLNLGWTKQI